MELEENKVGERGIAGENVDRCCGTCERSRWEGRGETYGQCLHPIPPIPSCFGTTFRKRWIYKHEGKECLCYRRKL